MGRLDNCLCFARPAEADWANATPDCIRRFTWSALRTWYILITTDCVADNFLGVHRGTCFLTMSLVCIVDQVQHHFKRRRFRRFNWSALRTWYIIITIMQTTYLDKLVVEITIMLKIATGSFPIGDPGFPKPVPEAPRDSQIRVREHFEQQVGLPWPIWAAIGTL